MFYYCYDIEDHESKCIYLYGRVLHTEAKKDLENIQNLESKIVKLTINTINIPIIAVLNRINSSMSTLKLDIQSHFKDSYNFEIINLKNMFYDDLEEELIGIRFCMRKPVNLNSLKSVHCKKIFFEFSSVAECIIVSKKIKCPCVIQFKSKKTFFEIEDIIDVIKCDIPKLNYAAINLQYSKNFITSYSICINDTKTFHGYLQENKKVQKCDLEENETNIKSNESNITTDILRSTGDLKNKLEEILQNENIDCVIYFNLHGQILKLFQKYIKCDIFLFATENIKLRDYSIEELCNYFKIEYSDLNNGVEVSRILYKIFFLSDALLLSKELSEISGFTLNKVFTNNRAEIIEYALFHELYDKGYLLPPTPQNILQNYTGGLVLNPIMDTYKNLILLLDFNSLYPSIIQEYNVCFSNKSFDSNKKGILPKILANLVQRRKAVKKLMKEDSYSKIYNIRQKALKILANSIYGCLGFAQGRFCNYKMAEFITQKARDILLDTKKSIEVTLGYKVIYGDTDSIMIDTNLKYTKENLLEAKRMSNKIKEIVDFKYKFIEIELEKIFLKLILYKKKKYAGIYFSENGELKQEYKGVDLIKRNVCKAVTDILKKLYDILLDVSTENTYKKEFENSTDNKNKVYNILISEYNNLEKRDKKDFIINNVLSKTSDKFKDSVPLPHVHLVRKMEEAGFKYNPGDVISYYIGIGNTNVPFYKRGFLLNENAPVDYDWYITQQIIPALNRIFSCTKFENSQFLYKIFKKEPVRSYTTTMRRVKFTTDCCKNIQVASESCLNCKTPINEIFYIQQIRDLIMKEIDILYKIPFVCHSCTLESSGMTLNCINCGSELSYNSQNEEFDKLIEELRQQFAGLNYKTVINLIDNYIKQSEYQIFDISKYFK